MSPSRGEKRKRSPSPSKSKSPEVKKGGKLGGLLSFLTPKKKETPSKKKRLSFGAPVNYEFDTCSPSCRPRPFLDNATLDAQLMERETLRVELECRQEEEDITVGIDLDTASQKSMAKLVNQLWNQDQLNKLEEWGVCSKGDKKLSRADLALKISVLHGLERKALVVMNGEHAVLPAQMDIDQLKEELRSRRIGTSGKREVLERRLEEAWIKEGSRFDVQGDDGYAFGRHEVTAREVVQEMGDEQLLEELSKPEWSLKKKSIPKTRMERQDLLEKLYSGEHKRRKELAFNVALNDMLLVQGLEASGPKALLFQRLTSHLKASGAMELDKSGVGSSSKFNQVLQQHQQGVSTSKGSAMKKRPV